MMIHSAKVTYAKRVTRPSDQLLFDQHQNSGLTPKRNIFHSNLKNLGMSIYLTIISNHFHQNISKIILSKRVMSFNKTHNRQLFSKPQTILLKRTHIHQCHTTFYVRAKSHFSLFSVLVQKDKKVIGQNSVDYRK